jgi:hypothetical protein
MTWAGKWRLRLVLTAVACGFAVAGLSGSAAAAEVPEASSVAPAAQAPADAAQPSPDPAIAPADPPPAEPDAIEAPSAPSTSRTESVQPADRYDSGTPEAEPAPWPSDRGASASRPHARGGRAQAASHGPRLGGAQNTAPEPPSHSEFPPCTIRGSRGDDTIHGTPGDDVICGGDGDDTIHGRGGNDSIRGGHGNDTVDGGPGNDDVRGERGEDVVNGGAGDDVVDGDGPPVLVRRPNGLEGSIDPPDARDRISCGEGDDEYALGANDRDEVAADCETPFEEAPRILPAMSGAPAGAAGPADAPTSAAGRILALRREIAEGMRHLVTVMERNLSFAEGTIKVVFDCNAGSAGWPARVKLTGPGHSHGKLASGKFKCVDDLTPVTVELDPSPRLEKLLANGDEVHARLIVRIRDRTVRAPVTITSA